MLSIFVQEGRSSKLLQKKPNNSNESSLETVQDLSDTHIPRLGTLLLPFAISLLSDLD